MEEDKLIPLSYISQFNYCKRRAALLMNEQQWSDSTDTVKGRQEHQNVHTLSAHKKGKSVFINDLQIYSSHLSLLGRCDSVEVYVSDEGVKLPFLDDEKYMLFPVEYKHGRIRNELEYELQLCAQAMCLEEMFDCRINEGAVFYVSSHRRQDVVFDEKMRRAVIDSANQLREMLDSNSVPDAEKTSKCLKCSLKEICMPSVKKNIAGYMKNIYNSFMEET